jgi:CRP-like cAMP-binding protein
MSDALKKKGDKTWTEEHSVSFARGANLLGDTHGRSRMFLVLGGQVRLTGRNKVIFDHLKRGSFLGERSLLQTSGNCQSATALSPVEAVAFRKADLMRLCRKNPAFALRLVTDLAMRLNRYEELICDLVSEQAEIRLARLLLRTAPPRPVAGWVRLPFAFTNIELARMVGTTRWRISYLLNRFQRLGWLRREDQLWLNRDGAKNYLAQH